MASSSRPPDDLPEWIYQLTMLPRFEGLIDTENAPPVPPPDPAGDQEEEPRQLRAG